ncbi:hypothetical protein LTR60_004800 [Cryomyces antarcticus]|nr:hypothetical protein LTR60_004800 [Cryomyces antarcticus]
MPGLRILVTGGSGFLGSAIVKACREQHPEWDVTVLDVKPAGSQDGLGFVKADITSVEEVSHAVESVRPAVLIHAAGVVPSGEQRYSQSGHDRDKVFAINVQGTDNMLAAARIHGVVAFIYTSSCTVVTDDVDHDYPNMDEELSTQKASLTYGQSKAAAEAHVLAANSAHMNTCAVRPSMVFGPGDTQVVPSIHACIVKGETPFIVGSGDNLYDFTFVTNAADAHVLAVENLLGPKTAAGEAFFISNQEPVPFRDFCLAVWAEFGHVPPYQVHIPATVAWFAGYLAEWATRLTGSSATLSRGSVKDACGTRYASGQKAKKALGYSPRIGLVDAVRLSCQVSLSNLRSSSVLIKSGIQGARTESASGCPLMNLARAVKLQGWREISSGAPIQ